MEQQWLLPQRQRVAAVRLQRLAEPTLKRMEGVLSPGCETAKKSARWEHAVVSMASLPSRESMAQTRLPHERATSVPAERLLKVLEQDPNPLSARDAESSPSDGRSA
jgi:hypothetical protein